MDGSACNSTTGDCPAGCDDGDPDGYMWRGAWGGPGCQVGKCQHVVTCGEEPGAGLAAKWVIVSNGYTWSGAWDGPGCQVGKCQ